MWMKRLLNLVFDSNTDLVWPLDHVRMLEVSECKERFVLNCVQTISPRDVDENLEVERWKQIFHLLIASWMDVPIS